MYLYTCRQQICFAIIIQQISHIQKNNTSLYCNCLTQIYKQVHKCYRIHLQIINEINGDVVMYKVSTIYYVYTIINLIISNICISVQLNNKRYDTANIIFIVEQAGMNMYLSYSQP